MSKCVTCKDREATTREGQCRWCWRKDYTKKNHEHIFKVSHANYLRNRERRREMAKIWNDKNRERKIANQKAYLKATGYASDKTPKRMETRRLRALTNTKYPILDNQLCELCLFNKADQRHHTTKPYHIDRFIFICKRCHDIISAISKADKTGVLYKEKTNNG